jgi:hypothetical protein
VTVDAPGAGTLGSRALGGVGWGLETQTSWWVAAEGGVYIAGYVVGFQDSAAAAEDEFQVRLVKARLAMAEY